MQEMDWYMWVRWMNQCMTMVMQWTDWQMDDDSNCDKASSGV